MRLAGSAESVVSSPAPAEVGATGFYVAVRTGARAHAALALGPYGSHRAARLEVDRVRRFVSARCGEAGWWLFETTCVTAQAGDALPVGTLNALLTSGREAA